MENDEGVAMLPVSVETQDLLDSLTQRIARRFALPPATAVSVVELYRHELATKAEPVSLVALVRLAKVGMIGPLTRQKGDSDDEC